MIDSDHSLDLGRFEGEPPWPADLSPLWGSGCALAWALVACFYVAYLALKHMAQAVIDLCNALAPEQLPVSLRSIRWPLVRPLLGI